MPLFSKNASGSDTFLVKAGSATLKAVQATNINAAIRYLQIFDKATAPVNTDVPVISVPIPAGSATNASIVEHNETFWGTAGYSFSLGLGVAISTAAASLTTATASDHHVFGRFE